MYAEAGGAARVRGHSSHGGRKSRQGCRRYVNSSMMARFRREFMQRGICAVVPVLALLGATLCCSAQNVVGPRVVDLTAADGTVLKASFFAAANPGPGVILFHQCNRQRKVWDDLAGRLASSGISVITLDFRGFGDSGGTPLGQLTPGEAGGAVD